MSEFTVKADDAQRMRFAAQAMFPDRGAAKAVVHLRAGDGGGIEAWCSDQSVGMFAAAGLGEAAGEFFPCTLPLAALSGLPKGLDLKAERVYMNNAVRLSAGVVSREVRFLEPPARPDIPEMAWHDAGLDGVMAALRDVRPFRDTRRHVVHRGTLLDGPRRVAVATNGHAMAVREVALPAGWGVRVVPPNIDRFDRLLSGDGCMGAGDGVLGFRRGGVTVICQDVQGMFPCWPVVVEEAASCDRWLNIDRAARSAIRSLAGDPEAVYISARAVGEVLHLAAHSDPRFADIASAEVRIPPQGDTGRVGMRKGHLLSALSKGCNAVGFKSGGSGPVHLRRPGSPSLDVFLSRVEL